MHCGRKRRVISTRKRNDSATTAGHRRLRWGALNSTRQPLSPHSPSSAKHRNVLYSRDDYMFSVVAHLLCRPRWRRFVANFLKGKDVKKEKIPHLMEKKRTWGDFGFSWRLWKMSCLCDVYEPDVCRVRFGKIDDFVSFEGVALWTVWIWRYRSL